jgi:hypothetical protein
MQAVDQQDLVFANYRWQIHMFEMSPSLPTINLMVNFTNTLWRHLALIDESETPIFLSVRAVVEEI